MRLLLLPESSLSREVLERLAEWATSGALQPLVAQLVAADGRVGEPWLYSAAGRRDTTLHAAAGELRAAPFAAVACYGEGKDGAVTSERFLAGVSDAIEAVLHVIPYDADTQTAPVMVVAPKEGESPSDLFSPAWRANLVIAREDRAAPDSPSAIGETSPAAHIAHALAVLMGLWRTGAGPEPPLIDRLDDEVRDDPEGTVRLVRAYTRIADFGYLTGHIAAGVFLARERWPNPDPAQFERVAGNQEHLDYLTDQYLEHYRDEFGRRDFDEIPLPTLPELSIPQAIRHVVRELILRAEDRLIFGVHDAIVSAHDQFARFLQRSAGPNAQFRVRLLRTSDTSTLDDLHALREPLKRPIVQAPGAVDDAWRDLVGFSLALMDGASLPEPLDESVLRPGEKRDVITDPRRIVPAPALPPAARTCDPRGHQDATDAEDPPPGAAQTPVWRVGVSILHALASAQRDGRVDESAEDRAAREKSETEAFAEAAKAAKQAKRKARRSLLLTLVLGGVVTVAAIVSAWVFLDDVALAGAATVLAPIAYLLLIGLRGRALLQLARATQLSAAVREIGSLNAELKANVGRADANRLVLRYAEYLDWAETIGWVAHRPWEGEPLRHIDVSPSIDQASTPAALSVGVADTRRTLDMLQNRAGPRVFRSGWLTGLFTSLTRKTMDQWAEEFGHDERDNPFADTGDDPQGPRIWFTSKIRAGDGRRLADNPMTADLIAFLRSVAIDDLASGVHDPGDDPASTDDPLPPATSWFKQPDNLPELVKRVQPTVVRISVRAGEAGYVGAGVLIADDGEVATARHVIEGANEIVVLFEDGTEVPATVERSAAETDVATLRLDNDASGRPIASFADGVQQGDPVITLGHPGGLKGESTLAWGLVTATNRVIRITDPPPGIDEFRVIQTTYQSAGGASGGPVFDLEGRLVGIHSASRRGEDDDLAFLSSAVPIDELIKLRDVAPAVPAAGPTTQRDDHPSSGTNATGLAPSAFLKTITRADGRAGFLPKHWESGDRYPNVVDRVITWGCLEEEPRVRHGMFPDPGLQVPIRIAACRVELSLPTAVGRLVGFDDYDPGAEEFPHQDF